MKGARSMLRLGDLVDEVRELVRAGGAPGARYVGLEQLPPGTLHVTRTLPAAAVTGPTKRFRSGDILFGTLRPGFRKVARARFDGVCSTEIAVLRPRDARDAAFAFYALGDPRFIAHATATANGTRMPRAKWAVLRDHPVAPLSAPARQRAGEVLSAYDELIEQDAKRIGVLEDLARSLHARLLDAVPEGARRVPLGELVEELREVVAPTALDPATPYFGLEHLPRRATTLGVWGRASDVRSAKLRVAAGDVLFGKIRPYFHKVGVAPVHAVASADALVLRPRRDDLRALTLGHVASDAFVARAAASSQGARMPRASWDVLRRDRVVVPPAPLLGRYEARAGAWIALASTLALRSRALAAMRDLLLPRALDGDLPAPPPEALARSADLA